MNKKNKVIEFERTAPDIQECKIIILHVINQAIKDYQHYKDKSGTEDIEIYETARRFLFDDTYLFDWGDDPLNLRRLCDHIEIDVDWLRNQIGKKLDLNFNDDGTVTPKKRY